MKNKQTYLKIFLLFVLIVTGIVAMQTYAQRSLSARVKDASVYLSNQTHSQSHQKYEPYYLTTNYSVDRPKGSAPKADYLPGFERKLIQKTELNLEVKDCQAAKDSLIEIIRPYNGVIVNTSVEENSSGKKSAQAIFKMDPNHLSSVMKDVRDLGILKWERTTADDVTAEYVDMEARLKNAHHVHTRLLSLLQKPGARLEEILMAEREISRVGEEIERYQARLNLLERSTALATVTVHYYEPATVARFSFRIGQRFKETLRLAVDNAIDVFNVILVLMISLIPVLFWIGVFGGIFLGVYRFLSKK